VKLSLPASTGQHLHVFFFKLKVRTINTPMSSAQKYSQIAVTTRNFSATKQGLLGKVLIGLQGIIQLKPCTLPLSAIELLSDAEQLPADEVSSLHNVLLKAMPPNVPTENLSDLDKGIRSNIN
jgi:hypothetical protein